MGPPPPAPPLDLCWPAGAWTPLHLDPWETHAWFAQLAGRKRFVLFPPEVVPHLADADRTAFADVRWMCEESPAPAPPASTSTPRTPRTPPPLAVAEFPDLPKALDRAMLVTLEPGDVLFLPAHWAHAVLSLPAGASKNSETGDSGCDGSSSSIPSVSSPSPDTTTSISLTHNFLSEAGFRRVRAVFLMWKLRKALGGSR